MTAIVDLTGVATPGEFHERVRQALDLPAWYGNNLDALHDLLSESDGLSVRFCGAAGLREASPRYAEALERLCRDLTQEGQGRTCTLEDGAPAQEPAAEVSPDE